MTPEKKLLLAIVKQAVRDYIRLDPDSDTVSAEYFINEGQDFLSAEEFLYRGNKISFGDLDFSFEDICITLDINQKSLKKIIARNIIEY